MKSKGKYNNKIIYRADGKFDSKKEYTFWLKLKRQEEMGLIRNLTRQVPFLLIPTQYETINGKKKLVERECKYIADFVYNDINSNQQIVIDCKGVKTPEYIIKRKLMFAIYGIKIREDYKKETINDPARKV